MSAPLARQRRNGCERKVAYATTDAAQAEADRLFAASGDALEVYRCPWADAGGEEHFHVGHRPAPPQPEPTTAQRIRARLAVIARHQASGYRLTAWQHAYHEDVRWLLDRLATD